MKFVAVLALVAAVTVVSAETNAQRFARGLPPMAPGKRASPVLAARKSKPSNVKKCNTGSLCCCESVQKYGSGSSMDELANLLGIVTSVGTPLGSNCSPLTIVGSGSNSCTQQTVCCDKNDYNGLINVGCTSAQL